MKTLYILGGLIIVIVFFVVINTLRNNGVPTDEMLLTQLGGGECKFEIKNNAAIKRGFFSGFIRRSDAEMCIIDAAKLLTLAPSTDTDIVPALIEALKNNPNVDSGDGIIKVRSEIALVLGKLGDKRALQPLNEILNSEDPVMLSKTGSFPTNYEIKKGTSHEAVRAAIAEINGR